MYFKKYKRKLFRSLKGRDILLALMSLVFSINANAQEDSLEQLTKTLANGSYSSFKVDNLPQTTNIVPKTTINTSKEDIENTESRMQLVFPEDYKRLKISTLYTGSDVYYDRESGDYFETKLLSNNIQIHFNIFENFAMVLDLDNENPFKNSWIVMCSKDRITDERSCFINKFNLVIVKSQKYGSILTVSKELKKLNEFSYTYIRIDKNKAHKAKGFFYPASTQKIIGEMKKGAMAHTRFQEWDGEQYEESMSLWGFSAAYDIMNKMYNRMK